MKSKRADLKLERLLLDLERDLTAATDEEILAAAHELGMDPAMRGSSAFFGVKILLRPGAMRKDHDRTPRSRVSLNWARRRPDEP